MRKNSRLAAQAGQSIVETVLMMPILLMLLLNAVNFGYFFFTITNLAAAPRAGVEYSIMGGATPAAIGLPVNGPSTNVLSSSFLTYEDMRGALNAPTTNASVQVCSAAAGIVNPGTTSAKAACNTYTGTGVAFTFPAAQVDPELNAGGTAPAFVLHQVDVAYKFTPLIPGRPFNVLLLTFPSCNASGVCVLHRQSVMRGMN
ncbi:MAG: TadE/TadG family type IV pilus assembly protein [Terriglobales bacterium]